MRHTAVRRVVPVLALLAVGACGPIPEEGSGPSAVSGHAIPDTFRRTASGGVEDTGDFVVQYEATTNEHYLELEALFQETRLLENTVEGLNAAFALPADVPVVMRECGAVNAFWNPETGEISLCYELVEHYSEIFLADAETEEELEEGAISIAGATVFTLFHEMGHALISIYDLPVTGREEDAVDQLATLTLLEGGEEGEDAAIDGANSFLGEEEAEIDDLAFWDEHSLDDQRFYNVLCWIYGKDPEGYQYLVDDEFLHADRADQCPAEYDRMARSWQALLAPYVRE